MDNKTIIENYRRSVEASIDLLKLNKPDRMAEIAIATLEKALKDDETRPK